MLWLCVCVFFFILFFFFATHPSRLLSCGFTDRTALTILFSLEMQTRAPIIPYRHRHQLLLTRSTGHTNQGTTRIDELFIPEQGGGAPGRTPRSWATPTTTYRQTCGAGPQCCPSSKSPFQQQPSRGIQSTQHPSS